ncbi:MAG: TonB family protein [Candidatus Zixiibacteriota bacterium]
MKSNNKFFLIIPLIIFLLFSCCTYYNTFYNAQKEFDEGRKIQKKAGSDEPNRSANSHYDGAIKKASKVLTFHPNSKWVDDALFLIGNSFYYKGEYLKAERKFKELLVNFPESDFTQDCHYFVGLCHYRMNNLSQAVISFNSIIQAEKRKKFKSDAAYALAEIHFEQKEYDDAIKNYSRIINDYKKEELMGKAQFRIAECYFFKKDYNQAKEGLSLVRNFTNDRTLIFESQFKTGECLYLLDQVDQGMNVFNELSREQKYFKYLPKIQLKIAQGNLLQDSTDLALKEFENITVTSPRTEESCEAFYQMGIIYQEQLQDLKKAKELFDNATKEKPQSETAKKALEKSANLAKLEEYQKQLTEAEKPEITLYLLAEAYLFEMNQPDSAISEFTILVEDYPESEFAPKSLYAIGWILENIKNDNEGAKEFYQKLWDQYPKSDYSDLAWPFLGISQDSAKALLPKYFFAEAERLLMKEGNVDSARSLYLKIVQDFPKSRYTPASEYALIWTQEQYDNPGDSTVILAYQELVDKYPDSKYANAARLKLGLKIPKKPKTQPKEEKPPPAEEQADSLVQKEQEQKPLFPLAPKPKVEGKFIYPESELESGIKGKVVLKIKIDNFNGEVYEAEIVNSLNNHYIDEAALLAAKETVFEPDSIDVMYVGGYFLYEVEVKPPETGDHTDKTGGNQ